MNAKSTCVGPESPPHQHATTSAQPYPRGLAVWAPILLLEGYLAFTVFLYFFGPVEWHIPSGLKLFAFLLVNYGGLYVGYLVGTRGGREKLREHVDSRAGVLRPNRFVLRLILVSMLFTIFTAVAKLIAVRGGLAEVFSTITNPGEAYIQAQIIAQLDRDGEATPIAGFSWAYRISTVLAALNGLYLPLAVACWRWLTLPYRALFFVTLFWSLLYAVGVGAQSGIGFLLFSLVPVTLYKVFVERKPVRVHVGPTLRLERVSGTLKLVLGGAAAVMILVSIVAFFQLDRAESSGYNLSAGDALVGSHGTPVTRGFPLFEDTRLGFGFTMAAKYVSHGYTGLALAMELPFEWTYGLGWSKGLQVMYRDYGGGPDIFEKSYLIRNEQTNDWPALWWWSTIFPWIASDTTFLGTVLFTLIVGYAIGRLWMSTVTTSSPLAFAVLGQLFVLVFMFPANNALAQTIDGVFAFVGVLLIYFVGRRALGASQ